MARNRASIMWRGRQLIVEFAVAEADPSVGIMSEGSEDHCLLDEDDRALTDLENSLSEGDWEEIAILVDLQLPDILQADDEESFYFERDA